MVDTPFNTSPALMFNLREADFTTSKRVAEAINGTLGPGAASPLDAVSIQVSAPMDARQRISLVSIVENIEVRPADPVRSEEHTSELQSLMRISYAVFCLTT